MSQSYDPKRVPVLSATPEPQAKKPFGVRKATPFVSPYDAQLLGQDGVRRGLKGGRPVLDAARTAYLETEWSGPDDRRLPKGILKKTKI